MLYYSLSTHQTVQACEQKHYYRGVRRLRPFIGDFAPEMGKLLHTYLAGYYASLKIGMKPDDAHTAAKIVLEKEGMAVTAAVDTAFFAGDEKTATIYNQLMPDCRAICEGYYLYRGRFDADMYEVLFIEEVIDAKISNAIRSRSVVDLITRHKDHGRIALWEHKSTKSVPDSGIRMRDLQTLLYSVVAERKFALPIDYINWNYLRTKLPAIPHQNKPDRFGVAPMSKAVGTDTTWDIYESALIEANLPVEDYADVRARLYNAEYDKFYPRFEHVTVAESKILLRDYVAQAKRTEALERAWAAGTLKPIRRLSFDCNRMCPFLKVCEAEIMGGDPEDVIKMRFSTPEQRQAPQTPWLEEYVDA